MANTPRLDRLDKNYLLNGGMDIPQRIASSTVNLSTSLAYYLDRWTMKYGNAFTGTPTVKQEVASPNSYSQFCMRMDGNASASNSFYEVHQRIESMNCYDMVAVGSASYRMWIFSASATQATVTLSYANSTDNFSTTTQFSSNVVTLTVGQWNEVSVDNVAVPSQGVQGVEIVVTLSAMSVTGSSQIHRITQAAVNAGTRASRFFSRFERHVTLENHACKRYYEKSYDLYNAPGTVTSAGKVSVRPPSANISTTVFYKAEKRTTPSVTTYSTATGASGQIRNESSNADVSSAGIPDSNGLSSYSTNNGNGSANLQFAWHWTSEAEL